MIAVDLTSAPMDAGVRLLEPVWRAVGYRVPGYMASDLRRDMRCSMGTMERFFATLAIEHDIEAVADGTEKPTGQLIVVFWPVEPNGKQVLVPRLYELPWLSPCFAPDRIAHAMSRMIQ